MLHYETIYPETLDLLKLLDQQNEFQGLRLVGGTSLALQYGHRMSVDLDFFGELQCSQDEIIELATRIGNCKVFRKTKHILQFNLNNVKIDVVDYSQYGWIDNPIVEDGLILASPKDISAMKINAIEGRGSKKDFIDVFQLLKHFDLDEILDFYSQKYPEYSIFRALLSLSYFDDAEPQAMPVMFIDDSWEDIKNEISEEVKAYQKEGKN